MEINIHKILTFNPKSKCKITFTFTEEWKHCYYQMKNDIELDPNDLPVLEEKYLQDAGEPLNNDNNKEVYDPKQDISYESYMSFTKTDILTSDTLIGLIQEKVKELINEGTLSEDFEDFEFAEEFEWVCFGGGIDEFLSEMGCTDEKYLENSNEYDNLLWFTAMQLDEEQYEIYIEELEE